jgi:hypothetical protein
MKAFLQKEALGIVLAVFLAVVVAWIIIFAPSLK